MGDIKMDKTADRIASEVATCKGWHATDPRIAEFDWINSDGIWPTIDEHGCLRGQVYNCEVDRCITGEVEMVDVAPDGTITADGSMWAISTRDWRAYLVAAK
jgi:hypothetical protein